MKTKKCKKIIILSAFIVIIAAVSIILVMILSINSKGLKIDGNTVTAQFSYSSDFVRVNNKLYYNYNGNVFNSGLYEISESGTKKLNSAEIHYFPEYTVFMPSLVVNDNQAIKVFDNGFSQIDSDEIIPFSFSEDIVWKWITSFNGKIYIISSENTNQNLYQYKNGELCYICKMNKDVSEFCIDENYLYYIDSQNHKNIIFKQSLSDESDCRALCEIKLNDSNISYFYMDGNNSYIAVSDKVEGEIYSTDNQGNSTIFQISEDGTATPIYSGNSIYMKYADNKLCYTDSNIGLYMYDADTDSTVKLFDGQVNDFWTVDDKYVYFNDKANRLFRVTVKEKTIEEVFG